MSLRSLLDRARPACCVGRFLPSLSKENLGADYDTSWARRAPARAIRRLLLQYVTRPLVRIVAPPTIIGLDRLEQLEGPVIFAGNHSSHLDTSLVLASLPVRFRHHAIVAAGADYWFDEHWKAAIAALWLNIIPIEREKVGRKSADLTASLIEDGWNLVIFPEGSRSRDGFIAPFRGGAAYLGIRCGVPIVPIHLEGTRRIFGVGARRVSPGPTRVVFGEPILPQPSERTRDLNVRIERAVAEAADEGRTDWWSARQRAVRGESPSLQGPEGVTGWRRTWAGSERVARRDDNRWP